MKRLVFHAILASVVLGLAAAPAAAAPNCEAVASLKLADTTITSVGVNASGTFTPPGARARALENLPPFCAVTGTLKPTTHSAIQFEVWLPETNWNGKLHVVGNGGL